MSASKLRILSRHREHMGVLTSPADFELAPGGSIAVESLVDDPRLSLYCLDHDNQRAIFTALPDGIDPLEAPFMYQAQFDHAEYLVAVPYADFLKLAAQLPPAPKLLCLHNIGRCGSTVMSRALNEIEGVLSLSEPDALTAFIGLRSLPNAEQRDLLRACVAWLARPAIIGDAAKVVIKFRNQAMAVLDRYVEALPEAQHFFMYRNVIDWLASFQRLRVNRGDRPTRFSREQIIEQQVAYYQCPAAEIERLAHPSQSSYLSLEGRALGWLFMLGRYLALAERCAPLTAIRYEDLQRERDAVLLNVLRLLDLPPAALSAAVVAFESDAQAGTKLARDSQRGNTVALPAEMQATVRRLLALQPEITRADYVLPGTLRLE